MTGRRNRQLPVLVAALLALLWLPGLAHAAQQFQGLCAVVKIKIQQELTLERIGFLATLEVTNNENDANITNFSAQLTFEDFEPDEAGVVHDASDLFFVQSPKLQGITAIDGTGIINPGETAVVEWFIIPKIAAGGETPEGIRYSIGAALAGSIYGQQIAPEVLTVYPDVITVKPEPQLEITYFQPRDVDGDDPFTSDVAETPIPFTLGVLVNNAGYGRAKDVKIASEQPLIVENEQALILVAQLLGSRVDDKPTDQTSLTVDLGDIEPGNCRKGAWDMITSLSGEFIEFRASYTHSSDLGGRDTSVITSLEAWFMVHEVMNDQPGRDGLKDFLADTIDDASMVPDTLYETDCNTLPVNELTQVDVVGYDGLTTTIDAIADFENWVYFRVDDPAQAKFGIASVVRSDGKVLNENNYWTNIRYRETNNEKLTYLNIFDFVGLDAYTYVVTYEPPVAETDPPVTTLRFAGNVEEVGGKFYVSPETQIYFTAEDESPVGIFYKFATDVDFLPAIPFSLSQPGEYDMEYYSQDGFGNEEIHHFATLVLSSDYPTVSGLTLSTGEFFFTGDSVSVRSSSALVSFDGGSPATTLDALVEVYRGVYAYPTLSGVPSTPTTDSGADIAVGGDLVDFYRYSLNGGAWSVETASSESIVLSGLSGAVQLRVLARSGYGDYGAEDEALTVDWTVDGGAAPLMLAGPTTPSRSTSASLTATGATYYCYRVDGTYYQPEPGVGVPIVLNGLDEGSHYVEILQRAGPADPCPGDVPGQRASWLVDRSYGTDLPPEAKVRESSFADVGSNQVDFDWDGLDEGGVLVPPDWYSIKVTLSDSLDRATSEVGLVRVGDLLAEAEVVAGVAGADQQNAHAAGDWVVWQDQRDGDWDVWAQDLADAAATPVPVANTSFNQERPRTDGEYVVWEDRQADGTWDIWARKLGSGDPAFPVTSSSTLDEQRPSVDWPWAVYQQRPADDPAAPWQLVAKNLVTLVSNAVDPTSQDQLGPMVSNGRVVWQDLRDSGAGEIYLAALASGEITRITDDPGGQIQPTIFEDWVVWADNRSGLQLDLYGYNLKRGVEVQLTDTPQDEARPLANQNWVVYTEDSAGEVNVNLKLMYLASQAAVQLTNFESEKLLPSLASGKAVWVDKRSGVDRVMIGDLPDLQPVFENYSPVLVTGDMVANQQNAYQLLTLWNAAVGVTEISRYTSLVPAPVSETATWSGGVPTGDNFNLAAGDFVWVKFDSAKILDLGHTSCGPVDLSAGVTALGYACFPDDYSAYQAIREIGTANVNALRVLDSSTGRWSVASVSDGNLIGEDFEIPRIAVVMVDLKAPQSQWQPGGQGS